LDALRLWPRLLLLAAVSFPGRNAAPLAGQATVAGVVLRAGTDRPIAEALVQLDTARQTTGADGSFQFRAVAAGSRVLRILHIAYAPRQDTLTVGDGDRVDLRIPLALADIPLAPITVEVRSRRLLDVGFYDRSVRGHGIYLTREHLKETKVSRLGDYLARIPGVGRTLVDGEDSRIDMRGGRSISMRCDTQFFLDGSALATGRAVLETLHPGNIEGIEIYRGASETPIQFDIGRTSCGAIVIWTRRS
jgi:hypothetical protein